MDGLGNLYGDGIYSCEQLAKIGVFHISTQRKRLAGIEIQSRLNSSKTTTVLPKWSLSRQRYPVKPSSDHSCSHFSGTTRELYSWRARHCATLRVNWVATSMAAAPRPCPW